MDNPSDAVTFHFRPKQKDPDKLLATHDSPVGESWESQCFILEDQFHPELHQARIVGCSDRPKRRGTAGHVGCQEVRLVQKIKDLSPELQKCSAFMSQYNFLCRGKIELGKSVRSHRIAAYVSK